MSMSRSAKRRAKKVINDRVAWIGKKASRSRPVDVWTRSIEDAVRQWDTLSTRDGTPEHTAEVERFNRRYQK